MLDKTQKIKLREALYLLIQQHNIHHSATTRMDWSKEICGLINEALETETVVEQKQCKHDCETKNCGNCELEEPSKTLQEQCNRPSKETGEKQQKNIARQLMDNLEESAYQKGRENMKQEILDAMETEEHLIHIKGLSMKNWNRVRNFLNT